MSLARFAPGSDDHTSSKGLFAGVVKGSTPKYARNDGLREEQSKNTMARMFMRVDQSEFVNTFLPSITDQSVRAAAVQLAGDPTRSRGQGANDTGYMDFLLGNVQHSFREKVQSVEVLSDNYVVYYFGQSAPVWTYTGHLINSVQDDQASQFVRLYLHVLRGTQCARRSKSVTLQYDSFAVNGTIESLDWSLNAQNELLCPFTMAFRVKRLYVTNYTANWSPTQPHGSIADPNAIAADVGGQSERRNAFALFASVPTGTEQQNAPTATSQPPADANPQQSSVDNSQVSMMPNANPNVRDTRPITLDNAVPPAASGATLPF